MSPSRNTSPARRGALWFVLLPIAVAHLPVLGHAFVFDDEVLLLRNPAVHGPLSAVFGAPYLSGGQGAGFVYWRPLTSLLLRLLWGLGGGSPLPFHAASLLLHLAASACALRLLLALGLGRAPAAAAVLLFGLHPAQVESVHWISALGEALFAALGFSALERHVRAREHGRVPLAGAALFFGALLAKETALAFALVVGLMEISAGPGRLRRLAPYAVASLLWLGLRALALGASSFQPIAAVTLEPRRIAGLLAEFGGFVQVLLWPDRLSPLRPPPALWAGLPFALVFAAALAAARRRRRDLAPFLWWIPALLAPILVLGGRAGVGAQGDRFLYPAVLGFTAALALLLLRRPRVQGFVLTGLLAAGYGARTITQAALWRDDETFWRRTVATLPEDPFAAYNLARRLLERGAGDPARLSEAKLLLQRARFLLERGGLAGSGLATLDHAVRLGLAWCAFFEARDPRSLRAAAAAFAALAGEAPADPDTLIGLGVTQARLGRLDEAERSLRQALAIAPDHPRALTNLARLLLARGRRRAARSLLERALAVEPRNEAARRLLDALSR